MKINKGSHDAEPGLLFLIDALGTLRSLVTAIARDANDKAMSQVIRAMMEQPDVEGCAILLSPEPRRKTRNSDLELIIAQGMESNLTEVAETLAMTVLLTGKPRYVPDLSIRSGGEHGSLVLIAIGFQGQTSGVLAFWNRQPARFQQWHRNLLELFGDVLGLYLVRLKTPVRLSCIPKSFARNATASKQAAAMRDASWETEDAARDPLTGLLARNRFEYRLDTLLGEGLASVGSLQLLYLDIDRFRLIRQFGGDQTADRVVQILADTVRTQVEHEIAVSRLGNDEIAVLVSIPSLEGATTLAQRLIESVDTLRMSYAGQSVDISISIGLAPFNPQWVSAAAALQQAQEACNAAQRQGGGTYQVYSEAICRQSRSQDEGLMLNRLTRALKEGDLILYAQPILVAQRDSGEGKAAVAMHEILLRMQDRRGNLLSAAAFLPLAEHYGLSVKLDKWVVSETLRTLSSSTSEFAAKGVFTLNLSGHSIDNPRLLEHIVAELAATGVAPEQICFEITETAAISDIESARNFIRVLKDIGCKFALDDFGSGHSSFLYLRDLNVDYLKIDGNLVRDITTDPVSHALVRSIDDIGKIMGKLTIAEYVESEEVLDALVEIGIDFVQGYYSGRPAPLGQVAA